MRARLLQLPPPAPRPHRGARPVARALSALLALALVIGLAGAGLVAYRLFVDRSAVPDLGPFLRFEAPVPAEFGEVYDATGQRLVELSNAYRIVRPEELTPLLREALLSAEDRDFFTHRGVDFSALARAAARTLVAHRGQGGRAAALAGETSTLTRRLVRAFFLGPRVSGQDGSELRFGGLLPRFLARAIGARSVNELGSMLEEMRLALWLEDALALRLGSRERAKEAILARFASCVYLGQGQYGFAAAAEYYFGKALARLDAAEAALLAGVVEAPARYAPRPGHLEQATRRRNEVLSLMAANGFLSPATASRLQGEPVRLAEHPGVKTDTPGAVAQVLDEVAQLRDGLRAAGLQGQVQVRTTIDARVQRIVDQALEAGLAACERRAEGPQGASVVLRNADAAILAESGRQLELRRRRATYTDFQPAVWAPQQPGSAMEPIVYLAGLRAGLFGLDTLIPEEPPSVPVGRHRLAKRLASAAGQLEGPMPARRALAESRGAVTTWVAQRVGREAVLAATRDVGIETPLEADSTGAAGASELTLLELANAYRALASGLRARPYAVRAVTGARGQDLYRRDDVGVPLAGDGRALDAIREGLRGAVRLPGGTAHALDARGFGIPVLGETATTDDHRNALFVGSTYGPEGITVAVRIGSGDSSPLARWETGARVALPVFREIVGAVYSGRLVHPAPPVPESIERRIDAYLSGERRRHGAAIPPDPPAGPAASTADAMPDDAG